jgi:hypothetical protein
MNQRLYTGLFDTGRCVAPCSNQFTGERGLFYRAEIEGQGGSDALWNDLPRRDTGFREFISRASKLRLGAMKRWNILRNPFMLRYSDYEYLVA